SSPSSRSSPSPSTRGCDPVAVTARPAFRNGPKWDVPEGGGPRRRRQRAGSVGAARVVSGREEHVEHARGTVVVAGRPVVMVVHRRRGGSAPSRCRGGRRRRPVLRLHLAQGLELPVVEEDAPAAVTLLDVDAAAGVGPHHATTLRAVHRLVILPVWIPR